MICVEALNRVRFASEPAIGLRETFEDPLSRGTTGQSRHNFSHLLRWQEPSAGRVATNTDTNANTNTELDPAVSHRSRAVSSTASVATRGVGAADASGDAREEPRLLGRHPRGHTATAIRQETRGQ